MEVLALHGQRGIKPKQAVGKLVDYMIERRGSALRARMIHRTGPADEAKVMNDEPLISREAVHLAREDRFLTLYTRVEARALQDGAMPGEAAGLAAEAEWQARYGRRVEPDLADRQRARRRRITCGRWGSTRRGWRGSWRNWSCTNAIRAAMSTLPPAVRKAASSSAPVRAAAGLAEKTNRRKRRPCAAKCQGAAGRQGQRGADHSSRWQARARAYQARAWSRRTGPT